MSRIQLRHVVGVNHCFSLSLEKKRADHVACENFQWSISLLNARPSCICFNWDNFFFSKSEITTERFLISNKAHFWSVRDFLIKIHSLQFRFTLQNLKFLSIQTNCWTNMVGLLFLLLLPCFMLFSVSIRFHVSIAFAFICECQLACVSDSYYKCWYFSFNRSASCNFFSSLVIKTNWHIQSIFFYLMHEWFSVN